MGMLLGPYNDKRQLEQQERLQRLEMEGQKEMAQYNQQLALQMWDKTNYAAQRAQLQKAGLSVGLMYGKGGPGGTTQTPTGNVTGASAQRPPEMGMAMQLGLQAALQKAQIENIQAQTENTKADTAKKAGVDTQEATARIANLAQATENAALANELMQYDKQLKQIETEYSARNWQSSIEQTEAATKKLIEDTKRAATENKISAATADTIITQTVQAAVEQSLRIELQQQQIIKEAATTVETYRKIEKISQEIINMQTELRQTDQKIGIETKKLLLERIKTEFGTGDDAQLIRWLNVIIPLASSGANMMK